MKTKATAMKQQRLHDTARDATFQAIADSFANDPRVGVGKMFGSVALKVNGKVFAMLVRGELVVKLPQPRVHQFVNAGRGKAFDPGHGKLMKEWLAVPGCAESWPEVVSDAYRFVGGVAVPSRG